MSDSSFKVQIQGLDQLKAKLAESPAIVTPRLQQAVSSSLDVLASNTTTDNVPHKTGNLVARWHKELRNLTGKWGPEMDYAPFVEFGTAPHAIYPKDKKALFWEGAEHPVKAVQHPGTAANPFMERILEASTGGINQLFAYALRLITQDLSS